jgi:hypothetical protein
MSAAESLLREGVQGFQLPGLFKAKPERPWEVGRKPWAALRPSSRRLRLNRWPCFQAVAAQRFCQLLVAKASRADQQTESQATAWQGQQPLGSAWSPGREFTFSDR